MTDLPPELHALLTAARSEHDPSAEDAERVRARMYAALAGTAAATGAASAEPVASTQAASGWLSAQLSGKLIVAALVLGGGAGLWAWPRPVPPARTVATERPRNVLDAAVLQAPAELRAATQGLGAERQNSGGPVEAKTAAHAARTPTPTAAHAPPVVVAAPTRTTAGSLRERAAARASQPAAGVVAATRGWQAPSPAPEPATADEPVSNQAPSPASSEVSLLRSALEAINAGQAERGLALLEAHAAQYPGGVLVQERQGLHVIALCALGRVEVGRREQASFLREHGQSPLAPRVRAACLKRGEP